MQALLSPPQAPPVLRSIPPPHPRLLSRTSAPNVHSLSPLRSSHPFIPSAPPSLSLNSRITARALHAWSSSFAPASVPPPTGESERAKLAQVSKRLEKTSSDFQRLGNLGFWIQLLGATVSAVILSLSTVVTGKVTSPVTFYATAAGIAAAFVSVFWSFGYIRLSERLRRMASDPARAPPRAEVVESLRNGIGLNIFGMGAAILGMQATVGLLVAKVLTSSAIPYYQGISPGQSPVLALDVFLVQAAANMILSHFLGLFFSLKLLDSVTVAPT